MTTHPRHTRPPSRGPIWKRPWGTRGFSLPEMMVVVAVMGMLLAVAIPNFTRYSARDRVVTAAADIQSGLTLARQKALARRVSYRVTLLSSPARVKIERHAGATWVPDPTEPIPIHDSVQATLSCAGDPGNTDLWIDPQGMVAEEDAPGLFTLCNDRADTSTVRMVRTGRVRTRAN